MTQEDQRTRDKLIQTATAIFAQKGFAATTVKDIADGAGVNISLISYHFQGKENLYKACIGPVAVKSYEMAKQILQPADTADGFRVRLELFVENMLIFYADNPYIAQIVQRELDMPSPFFEDLFQSVFLKKYCVIVDYIAHAQTKKIVREALCADGVAAVLVGSVVHYGRSAKLIERFFGKSLADPVCRKEIVDSIVGIVMRGVLV